MKTNRNNAHFQQGSGCYQCGMCKKLTRDVGNEYAVAVQLCVTCYDKVTMDNAHYDGHHDEQPKAGCRFCAPKAKAAKGGA